ncbi:MAG: 50S ribosomal protein L15e, partial [Candidatus Bathyarchaeia archaeon]
MAYKYMAEAWRKPDESYVKEIMRQRVVEWRKQPSIIRIDKPTRIDRARRLGYKD